MLVCVCGFNKVEKKNPCFNKVEKKNPCFKVVFSTFL